MCLNYISKTSILETKNAILFYCVVLVVISA